MEKELEAVTKEEMLNPSFIPSIFKNYDDPGERNTMLKKVMSLAKEYKISTKVKKSIDLAKAENIDPVIPLSFDNNGLPEPTIDNLVSILTNDKEISGKYFYNSLSGYPMRIEKDGSQRMWNDTDDSEMLRYIETTYGIYYPNKYFNAFNIACSKKQVHPIKALLESKEWDRKPRIDRFLVDIMKCEDNNYSREVSRMIFYGGISRLYKPGCKFDYMPIFIGKQGTYKSTIVNWLAIHDNYAGDINTIEGKDALDNIQGRWICEFSELLALVRTKDVEAMKSFITRPVDKYRTSYSKRTSEFPRQCIFIGTTNDSQFLYDKTGNRRYLPIVIGLKPGELSGREKEIREYIIECWREALVLFKENKVYLTIPSEYYDDVIAAQENAVEDDPKLGILTDYLNEKKVGDRVCTIEIFTNCFNGLKKNFNRLEAKEISRVLSSLPDWERKNSTHRFETFGTQKYWEKIDPNAKWGDLS